MQIAVIEYARNVADLEAANSTEFDSDTPHPVIHIMDDQKDLTTKGGNMRLGACPCRLSEDSNSYHAYEQIDIEERHRHRFEFNNAYRAELEKNVRRVAPRSSRHHRGGGSPVLWPLPHEHVLSPGACTACASGLGAAGAGRGGRG